VAPRSSFQRGSWISLAIPTETTLEKAHPGSHESNLSTYTFIWPSWTVAW
jgi:hypothetical protein